MASDFSQIELRVLAYFSQDPNLLRAYWNDEDIHDQVAHEVFKVPPGEAVSKEVRRNAKAINFGIVYGIQAKSLSKQIDADEYTAQSYINAYLTKYCGVYKFQEYIKDFVREHKFVKNLFGRIHNIPEIDHPDDFMRGEAERTALNSPIQGTAGELTNICSVMIYLKLQELGIDAKLVLTVHDELTYEVREDHVMQASKIIYETMRDVAEQYLKIPVHVDQYVNDRWLSYEMVSKDLPTLHQARFLKKRLNIKLRDFMNLRKYYVSKLQKPKEVVGS